MKKMFRVISVIFFLYNLQSLYAQQWKYYNPTYSYDVNTIELLGPGIIVVGGGWETRDSVQIMVQTTDYGLTWYENAHDGPAPWNKSVAFHDSLNGYGVCYDGKIIMSDDAGRNWDQSAIPINRDLNKIIYVDAGTYYVAGGNKTRDSIQTILKSTNFGSSWSVIYDVPGPWLKSLYFADTLKGFAVGDNGVILATTNGGNSWTHVTAPVQRNFNAITFINADTGYIVGGTPTGMCKRTILKTVDGGANWSVLIDNTGGILKDISFADTLVGYTVGDSATVLKTIDGGLNWVRVIIDTNLTGNESFNAVKFYNRNFGAIGGKAGLLYIYRDLPVEAYTMGSSQIGNNNATLLGGINTHTKNARFSFIYSNNVNFGSSDSTQGINIRNDSLLLVSEYIQGLTPNITYYYYLKAVTASDTIFGDTLTFFTGTNPPFDFQTVYATGIRPWLANLNGLINKFPVPVNLFFEYGSSPAFGSRIAASPASINDTLMHTISATINGLQENTRYYFRLKGVTASGLYYGDTKMFDAVNLPYIINPVTYMVFSLTSVGLNGRVNNNGLPAALKFEYGPTSLYGNEVNAIPDSAISPGYVSTSCVLNGLSPSITYHYRLKATNSNGTAYGEDKTFITGVPVAGTLPASDFGVSSARLNGFVNANSFPTTIIFEYGLTPLYGNEINAVPGTTSDTVSIWVSGSLSGLLPATSYHFRIKAINSNGTSYGEDVTFVTGAPSATTLPASNIGAISTQLNGRVNANSFPTINKFEYGTSASYGNEITAIPDSLFGMSNENISYPLTGLLQNTAYHYRVKASNSNGTSYGEDMTFVTGAPSASTLPASNIGENSAQLNGIVNANNFPTVNEFEFGTSTGYGTIVVAVPDSTTGSGNVTISYLLSGLSPNSTFHYRVKATNLAGTNYGNDLMFTTGATMTVYTSPATEITTNSVKLNGVINAGGIPAAVKFEYGTTTAYGDEIIAVPDSSSIIGSINAYALLTGLMPNTTYHFRIKGANSALTKYGEDMMFFTGQPEIPNFDFELWTPVTQTKPYGYDMSSGKISQYDQACHNDFAVRIENDTNCRPSMPGVILIGNSNDMGHTFIGGIPFNAHPDTLIGCFNYSIPNNDTALILLILKKQGVDIAYQWFKIYGSSSGNYTDLKFPIPYTSGSDADSLIIGFTVTDIRNIILRQEFPSGGYLIVDHIHFTGTTENIPNNDFENWEINTYYSLDGWWYPNKDVLNPVNEQVVSRTTDAHHGNYAALAKTFFYPDYTSSGYLTTNSQVNGPGFGVNGRHQSLTGYYKFLPENNDTMNVGVFMYKNHVLIGAGYFLSNTVVTEYTPFVINISYNDTIAPDSGQITISSYRNRPLGASQLYIDNLNFDGFLSGIKEPAITVSSNIDFYIYPNPFNEKAIVSFTLNQEEHVNIRLYDLSGKQVAPLADCTYKAGNYKLDLSAQGLQKGFYICVINTGNQALSRKLIVY